jgi:peptidoglycan/xylan/chitin deacetylase (PgdA/CDA1 family)
VTGRFACLTYHRIGDRDDQYTVSEAQFCAQMSFLQTEGYTVEGFKELHHRLQSKQGFPDRYVVLTLDDGHSSAMVAANCIARHGFRATFFVTRDYCLKKLGFIRERDLRELHQRGFSLGTHGATHRKLTQLPAEQCQYELAASRTWLEDSIGELVYFTAVPGGFVNAIVMRLAVEEGYALVGTCNEWMNAAVRQLGPAVKINRVNIRRHFSTATFRKIIEGDPSFYLRRQLRAAFLWLPKQLLPS